MEVHLQGLEVLCELFASECRGRRVMDDKGIPRVVLHDLLGGLNVPDDHELFDNLLGGEPGIYSVVHRPLVLVEFKLQLSVLEHIEHKPVLAMSDPHFLENPQFVGNLVELFFRASMQGIKRSIVQLLVKYFLSLFVGELEATCQDILFKAALA